MEANSSGESIERRFRPKVGLGPKVLWLAACITAFVGGFWLSASSEQPLTPTRVFQQTLNPTPSPPANVDVDAHPLFTAAEAISRSLQQFPEGITPTMTVARLVSIGTLNNWRGIDTTPNQNDAPAWLVGITGDSLRVGDVLLLANDIDGATLVDGSYYAWNANGGWPLGVGALGDAWPQNITSLSELSNEQIPIAWATAMPTPATAATELSQPPEPPTETPEPYP